MGAEGLSSVGIGAGPWWSGVMETWCYYAFCGLFLSVCGEWFGVAVFSEGTV